MNNAARKTKPWQRASGRSNITATRWAFRTHRPTAEERLDGHGLSAVYEGEDSDDGTIKLTAGKLQKTGVRSEPVELQAITVPIRAPGTIQVDERLSRW